MSSKDFFNNSWCAIAMRRSPGWVPASEPRLPAGSRLPFPLRGHVPALRGPLRVAPCSAKHRGGLGSSNGPCGSRFRCRNARRGSQSGGSEALRSGDGDVSEIPASIEVRKGLRIPAHGHVEVLVPCGDADEMRF